MTDKPTMHCQSEIEADTGYSGFLADETLFRWFHDRYSTSKHLLTLYSIAGGLNAKTIVEVVECRIINHIIDTGAIEKVKYMLVETHDHKISELKDETDTLRKRIKELGLGEKINLNWV